MFDSEGDALYEFIAEMVRKKKVLYVHFRNVSEPNQEKFHEEFINTGHVDMYREMKAYHDNGYDSSDGHVPHTHQDTQWGHRGRAFANGYIQAMIEAVTKGGQWHWLTAWFAIRPISGTHRANRMKSLQKPRQQMFR